MVQLSLDCPHPECLTEKAGFSGSQYLPIRPQGQTYIMLMQCGVCGNGIVAKFEGSNFPFWVQGQPVGNSRLVEIWPKRTSIAAPQHIPQNVQNFYKQGMDSLGRKNFDAAGTMFRKSLDAGLKKIDPAGKGNLQDRIDNLPVATGITPAMKQWAHQIRHLGNDAAHEEDPFTEDEAKTLQSFTELFLTYAFTLPGMLAARNPPAVAAP